jgi:hypothetical protein
MAAVSDLGVLVGPQHGRREGRLTAASPYRRG